MLTSSLERYQLVLCYIKIAYIYITDSKSDIFRKVLTSNFNYIIEDHCIHYTQVQVLKSMLYLAPMERDISLPYNSVPNSALFNLYEAR